MLIRDEIRALKKKKKKTGVAEWSKKSSNLAKHRKNEIIF